jgi:uncharacterized protein YndB with AHSA1/START domain
MSAVIDTGDRELVVTRMINAPRERVFAAFSDPANISLWWGPNGFSTTTHEMAFKVGGVWRYVMHGPDGTDYNNKVAYTDIVAPERICYDHGDFDKVEFKTVILFEERGEKTFVSLRMIGFSEELYQNMKKFGATEGGNQTLARLDAYLAKESN